MRKIALTLLAALTLTGCGTSEAEADYRDCNDEYAKGTECTEREFKDYLILDYENGAAMFGGADKATPETTAKYLGEINQKVEEIFGE